MTPKDDALMPPSGYEALRAALEAVQFKDKLISFDPEEWQGAVEPRVIRSLLAAHDALKAERDALVARLEAVEKDAARYRHIKSLNNTWYPKGYNGWPDGWFELEIEGEFDGGLDAAVDAALAHKEPQ